MPAGQLAAFDDCYGTVKICCLGRAAPQAGRPRPLGQAPIVCGWVICIDVEHVPRATARAQKTLWLWWSAPPGLALDPCWRACIHRFDIEHAIKFQKATRLGHPLAAATRAGGPVDRDHHR